MSGDGSPRDVIVSGFLADVLIACQAGDTGRAREHARTMIATLPGAAREVIVILADAVTHGTNARDLLP